MRNRLYYFEKQLPIFKPNKEELKDNLYKSAHNFEKLKNIELSLIFYDRKKQNQIKIYNYFTI